MDIRFCFLYIGTPFQFQLPQGNLLRPLTRIVPPSQNSLFSEAASSGKDSVASVARAAGAVEPSTDSPCPADGQVTVSPSEVKQDFFHSTPISAHQDHSSSQLAGKQSSAAMITESCQNSDSELISSTLNSELSDLRGKDVDSVAASALPQMPHVPSHTFSKPKPPVAQDIGEKSREGFEMGMDSEAHHDSIDYSFEMSLSLPAVVVPSDSQFESSENTEVYFKLTKPCLNQSTTSETEDMHTEAGIEENKSLFSDVKAGYSKRQKLSSTDVFKPRNDPYEFSSQNEDGDTPVVLYRQHQRKGMNSVKDSGVSDSQEAPSQTPNESEVSIQPTASKSGSLSMTATESSASGQRKDVEGEVSAVALSSSPGAPKAIPIDLMAHESSGKRKDITSGVSMSANSSTKTADKNAAPSPNPVTVSSDANPDSNRGRKFGVPAVDLIPSTGTHGNATPGVSDAVTPEECPDMDTGRRDGTPEVAAKTAAKNSLSIDLTSSGKRKNVKPDVCEVTPSANPDIKNTPSENSLSIDTTVSGAQRNSSPSPSIRITHSSRSPVFTRSPSSPVRSPMRSRLPGHHLPSPLSSFVSSEFVSPSRSISAEGLQELRRQVVEQSGREAGLCELHYVRTVCTVIEERIISSELIEDGKVVAGSEKVWPVS